MQWQQLIDTLSQLVVVAIILWAVLAVCAWFSRGFPKL